MRTYNDIYLQARKELQQGGIEDYSLEAKLLLCSASNKNLSSLMKDFQLYTTDEISNKVSAYVKRRLTGEPIAYITESWQFYGIDLYVNKNVLIPRPDTEVLVDAAKEILSGRKMNARILDLCCGSGCITCALAKELPAAKFLDIDVSSPALDVARKNIADLDIGSRVVCMNSDVLLSPPFGIGVFDMIVSNPPYIQLSEISTLATSVKDFEPFIALDGGDDGLKFYRSIIKYWKAQLCENGYMLFEVGEQQSDKVLNMMLTAGFKKTYTKKDVAGVDRVVIGQI